MLTLLIAASLALAGPLWSAELRLGNAGEPQTLDPHRYNLRLEETILTDLFLGLTAMSADGRIGPGAAESWTVSDDDRSRSTVMPPLVILNPPVRSMPFGGVRESWHLTQYRSRTGWTIRE